MGCISSKAITRSMSIREELSHGLKTSHSDNHLFALVCSSNDYLLHLITDIHAPPPHVALPHPDSCKFTRSKSCHALTENRTLDLEDKNVGGSRSLSFHTVEEYDALLERINRGTRGFQDCCFPCHDVNLQESTNCVSQDDRCNQPIFTDSGEDSGSVDKGWKRKAIGRGLKSLDVEFPAISRLKQRMMLVQGQIYSPGTYVTPKFGSYNDPATATQQIENETKEEEEEEEDTTVFSSELLAAFEDCMQQLQLEEDTILRHLDNSSLQNQLANPSNM